MDALVTQLDQWCVPYTPMIHGYHRTHGEVWEKLEQCFICNFVTTRVLQDAHAPFTLRESLPRSGTHSQTPFGTEWILRVKEKPTEDGMPTDLSRVPLLSTRWFQRQPVRWGVEVATVGETRARGWGGCGGGGRLRRGGGGEIAVILASFSW